VAGQILHIYSVGSVALLASVKGVRKGSLPLLRQLLARVGLVRAYLYLTACLCLQDACKRV